MLQAVPECPRSRLRDLGFHNRWHRLSRVIFDRVFMGLRPGLRPTQEDENRRLTLKGKAFNRGERAKLNMVKSFLNDFRESGADRRDLWFMC
jgi:hypothetical protein